MEKEELSLRLVDDLWGWGGKRVVVKTCWCRWSMRLRREARAPLAPNGWRRHELRRMKRSISWIRFLSWLTLAVMLHMCVRPLRGNTFLFECIYLFVRSCHTGVDDIPTRAARCCLHFSLRRHAALERKKTHIVIEKPRDLEYETEWGVIVWGDPLSTINTFVQTYLNSPSVILKTSGRLNGIGVDIC